MTTGETKPTAVEQPASPGIAKAPRELPSQEQIAAWTAGADLPSLSCLFDQLNTVRFDALTMQLRKEELLPQHWQVISQRRLPDGVAFEELAIVRRLRERYGNERTAESRIAALETAWGQLGGKAPTLWTVADLIAVLRRVIDQKIAIDFHDLLSALRDVWTTLTLPHGRTQLDQLWAVLAFVREKTKK